MAGGLGPRNPEVFLQVHNTLLHKINPFASQAFFHNERASEALLAAKGSKPVYHSVARQGADMGYALCNLILV